jgi:hypothetical protein
MAVEVAELYKEYDEHVAAGKPNEIPQTIIDEVNADIDAYFSKKENHVS